MQVHLRLIAVAVILIASTEPSFSTYTCTKWLPGHSPLTTECFQQWSYGQNILFECHRPTSQLDPTFVGPPQVASVPYSAPKAVLSAVKSKSAEGTRRK